MTSEEVEGVANQVINIQCYYKSVTTEKFTVQKSFHSATVDYNEIFPKARKLCCLKKQEFYYL